MVSGKYWISNKGDGFVGYFESEPNLISLHFITERLYEKNKKKKRLN